MVADVLANRRINSNECPTLQACFHCIGRTMRMLRRLDSDGRDVSFGRLFSVPYGDPKHVDEAAHYPLSDPGHP